MRLDLLDALTTLICQLQVEAVRKGLSRGCAELHQPLCVKPVDRGAISSPESFYPHVILSMNPC